MISFTSKTTFNGSHVQGKRFGRRGSHSGMAKFMASAMFSPELKPSSRTPGPVITYDPGGWMTLLDEMMVFKNYFHIFKSGIYL